MSRARLSPAVRGPYAAAVLRLPPGRHLLTVVDTASRGEAAVAARALTLARAPAQVRVVLPATSTPGRYVTSALLGPPAPLLRLGAVLRRPTAHAGRGQQR